MEFITHNQDPHVVDESTWGQGTVKATYSELVNLFGKPTESDGYKSDAEWRIRFSDGTVATVYNWKDGPNYCGKDGTPVERITEWHIGGTSKAATDHVQIAIDLHREMKDAGKKKRPFEEVFETAVDMMDTVRATKGENFARVVENAMLVRKIGNLFSVMVSRLVQEHKDMPVEFAQKVADIHAEMSARIISNTARVGGCAETDENYAKEVMHWVDQMLDLEARGAEEIVKEMRKEGRA